MPWYFPELAALFIIVSIVVGLIGGLGEEGMVNGMIQGMGDFMGAAFIIAIARGVTVIMNNAGITDTVLHSLEGVVSGLLGRDIRDDDVSWSTSHWRSWCPPPAGTRRWRCRSWRRWRTSPG